MKTCKLLKLDSRKLNEKYFLQRKTNNFNTELIEFSQSLENINMIDNLSIQRKIINHWIHQDQLVQ